jgi:hypothetical protein
MVLLQILHTDLQVKLTSSCYYVLTTLFDDTLSEENMKGVFKLNRCGISPSISTQQLEFWHIGISISYTCKYMAKQDILQV